MELKELLAPFSHLSARERAGRDILRDLTGREAALVLDPTLLPDASDWEELSRYPAGYPAGAYILCYCIRRPGVLVPYVRALARRTGLPVVQFCGVRRRVVPDVRCVLDAGPAEFLGLFRHAAAVVTNSFHGTAFSIQFRKPFFSTVSPRELSDPSNARTYGLLRRLGLADRVAGTGRTASVEAEIDWDAVERILQAEREASRAYLATALSGNDMAALYEREMESAPGQRESGDAGEETHDAPPVLASWEDCTGCTACLNICPRSAVTMERDSEGFLRPVTDAAACIRCGRCAAVCPALHLRETVSAVPAVFAAWNRNPDIRREFSSGGVFSVLAETVLGAGGIVFGAAMDDRQRVSHAACFKKEDLQKLRGAKNVQSDLRETFRLVQWAPEKRPALFSSTHCQVDGLYHYLGGRPEKLLTCDLVCHGVPSPGVWEDMVQSWRQERKSGISSVRFRDKGQGEKFGSLSVV